MFVDNKLKKRSVHVRAKDYAEKMKKRGWVDENGKNHFYRKNKMAYFAAFCKAYNVITKYGLTTTTKETYNEYKYIVEHNGSVNEKGVLVKPTQYQREFVKIYEELFMGSTYIDDVDDLSYDDEGEIIDLPMLNEPILRSRFKRGRL